MALPLFRPRPGQYVKSYRSISHCWDGKILDRTEHFRESQSRPGCSMHFEPGHGFRRQDAETLIHYWNILGSGKGLPRYKYSIEPFVTAEFSAFDPCI